MVRLNNRIVGIDIVRTIAILFVIAGHFFSLHTNYRNVSFEGFPMFLQGFFAQIFSTGVPLFMILTGYLNCNKEVNKKYFKGISRVLIAYVVFSIISIFFRKFYLEESYSTFQWIMKITDYSAMPYSWYIEMWIGLFLMTPFLNYLYKAIPTKREKFIGLIILFLLMALPDFFNRYGMYLMPGYWKSAAFPLFFFFSGSFIHEYQIKINVSTGLTAIATICLIQPLGNIILFKNHDIVEFMAGPSGPFLSIVGIIVFILVYHLDIKQKYIRGFITRCAVVSLEMYLCCYIFDMLYYPYFKDHYYVNQSQFGLYFFIIVPLIFFSSFCLAWIYNTLYNIIVQKKE